MTPPLHAIPETTRTTNSPSSFPSSPDIVNHKHWGPSFVKSSVDEDASASKKIMDEGKTSVDVKDIVNNGATCEASILIKFFASNPVVDECASCGTTNGCQVESIQMETTSTTEEGNNGHVGANGLHMQIPETPSREVDSEDFYEPHESMSYTSNIDREEFGTPEHSCRLSMPGQEFYDTWEELSSDGRLQSSLRALEEELQGIRLSLLMEIEKRKQAEEALQNMQISWQRMREQLSFVGLTLPVDLTLECGEMNVNPVEEVCQQVQIARFVSEAVGRGVAKAEAEIKMEAQFKAKNFDIVRLCERVRYYEVMKHEMSQRNQEIVELARLLRLRRKRRQRWIWSLIAITMSIGASTLTWSYIQAGKAPSSIMYNEILECREK